LGFQPPAAIVVSAPAEVGLSQDRLARVDSLLDSLAERREVAGGVALIARHGRVAYFRSFGVMDLESGRPVPPDAIFRVASMTKPIVSVAAMVLYEEGAVQLDDPVSRYLPEVAAMQAPSGPAARQMTIQDLLRHTSGIPYGRDLSAIHKRYVAARLDSAASLQEMVAQMAALPLLFPPGSRWEYGYSTDVLGRVIEVVSQQPLDVFLRERVLEPLGMMDTDFFVPAVKHDRFMTLYAASAGGGLRATDNPSDGAWSRKPGLLSGGAGLVSTAPDYWRFSQMLLNGGALAGVRILSPTTVRLMTVNQVPPAALPISLPKPESAWMVSGTGFGLGFRVVMDPAEARIPASVGSYGWFGSHDTFFLVDPTEDLVGIFLAQFTGPPAYPGVRTFQNLLFQAIEH
jgi:CubicO group peptidase (beta-lactamase class C family)